jgi:hypothetical protein
MMCPSAPLPTLPRRSNAGTAPSAHRSRDRYSRSPRGPSLSTGLSRVPSVLSAIDVGRTSAAGMGTTLGGLPAPPPRPPDVQATAHNDIGSRPLRISVRTIPP